MAVRCVATGGWGEEVSGGVVVGSRGASFGVVLDRG